MKIQSLLAISLFLILISSDNFSQTDIKLENWKTHSSILNVVSADVDSRGRIWAGSPGGLFVYDESNQSIKEFRNLDALLSLEVTAVKANRASKEVYIGTFDGVIDIVSEDFVFTHITDILRPNFPNARINDIIFNGDLAYIGGGFGLTVFDTKERVFRQTPPRLGSFKPNTQVNQVIIANNVLWVATDEGVASIKLSSSIVDPESWTNYTTANGLYTNKINGIAESKGKIYCASDTNVYSLQDTVFKSILTSENWNQIKTIKLVNDTVCFSTPFMIKNIYNTLKYQDVYIKDTAQINGFVANPQKNELVICLNESGMVLQSDQLKQIKPESPASNLFTHLAVDRDGALWSATDQSGRGRGFMKLYDNVWENFNLKLFPEIKTNSYFKVCAIPDGRVALSSWGNGLLIVSKENGKYSFNLKDYSNSCLTGAGNGNLTNYTVVGESAYDPRTGAIWAVNYAHLYIGSLFYGQDKTGKNYCFVDQPNREFMTLAIDYSGTKWAGSIVGDGLMYFNEGSSLDNPSLKTGSFNTSNSQLQSSTINCITVDKSGIVWVGTPNGLAYILQPSAVLRDAKPILRPTNIKLLASTPINYIMVDALNNKWIATNDGVWVIDADGITELMQINKKNSPLITDEIVAMATNEKTGQIYFGTRKGLSEVTSFSVKPLPSYNISCYPQPYIPAKDGNLIIEGLAENSNIRILTTDGELVKSITTTSQKIIWDGRNEKGEYVSTGIYLIMGQSSSSDASGVAKCAIINQ
jgi:ligand-binding sensor domain-containing protein